MKSTTLIEIVKNSHIRDPQNLFYAKTYLKFSNLNAIFDYNMTVRCTLANVCFEMRKHPLNIPL